MDDTRTLASYLAQQQQIRQAAAAAAATALGQQEVAPVEELRELSVELQISYNVEVSAPLRDYVMPDVIDVVVDLGPPPPTLLL